MTPETAANWISLVFLAGMMGALRQVVRSVAGLKKSQEFTAGGGAGFAANFRWPVFVASLIISLTAGALACLTVTFPLTSDAKFLLTFIAAGYAGADFIEPFVRKQIPADGSPRIAEPARLEASPAAQATGNPDIPKGAATQL